MSRHTHTKSLRFRLAATFACFGALVSILLSAGLSIAAHDQNQRLMDEALSSEIEDTFSRRQRNPKALPPATVSIRGYIYDKEAGATEVPAEVRALPPGRHQQTIAGIPYRIAVADKGMDRYAMLFNEQDHRRREERFWLFWIAATLLMTLAAGGIGWWLSGRIVSPVSELARRVAAARIDDDPEGVAAGFREDEIGQLARVFGGYLARMRSFSERERAFTTDVSHELRTPLAIILGAVELLDDDAQLDERQRQRLARIDRAARQMIDLTATLMVLAREPHSEDDLDHECDVAEAIGEVIEAYRTLARPEVALDLVVQGRPKVSVERCLLDIVVANLIRNALAHTERGSVTVTVDAQSLAVADTGRGIPDEEIGKVFDLYFKGSTSAGAGIGLSLVKRICDRQGWQIAIESRTGGGTTILLRLVSPQESRELVPALMQS